jgi:hypothetical protein
MCEPVHPSQPLWPARAANDICMLHVLEGNKITMIAKQKKKYFNGIFLLETMTILVKW